MNVAIKIEHKKFKTCEEVALAILKNHGFKMYEVDLDSSVSTVQKDLGDFYYIVDGVWYTSEYNFETSRMFFGFLYSRCMAQHNH